MASVATAASQPGVSVVSMSWGFAEGQAVFASDEAMYDSLFRCFRRNLRRQRRRLRRGRSRVSRFLAQRGGRRRHDPHLNSDNSYNSETGWGYYSSSVGAFIGSGGGISLYEPEPAYQLGVQSTGYRTSPDVSLVADPATGAWIADPYNLNPSNPFEVVGGRACRRRPGPGCLLWSIKAGRPRANRP